LICERSSSHANRFPLPGQGFPLRSPYTPSLRPISSTHIACIFTQLRRYSGPTGNCGNEKKGRALATPPPPFWGASPDHPPARQDMPRLGVRPGFRPWVCKAALKSLPQQALVWRLLIPVRTLILTGKKQTLQCLGSSLQRRLNRGDRNIISMHTGTQDMCMLQPPSSIAQPA